MLVRPRLALLAPAVAVGVALAAAAPAQAFNCADFKNAVNTATNGDVITLNAGAHCTDTYTLPSTHHPFAVTIQGAGAGATLDGSTNPGAGILTGTPQSGEQ